MIDLEVSHVEVRNKIAELLIEHGIDKSGQFILLIADLNHDENVIQPFVIMSDTCGTCAGFLLDAACNVVLDGVKNGRLTVHAMPEVYKDSQVLN